MPTVFLPNKAKRKRCVVCGKPTADTSDRFCSTKCRAHYIQRKSLQDKLNGNAKMDSIDEKLRYCKECGITYAEYQVLETLGKLDKEWRK